MSNQLEAPVERDEYTAKQVATRIGTDPKTLRKFFRSAASTVEPVGQGGRYVFAADTLPQIKAEFDQWNSTKATRSPRGSKPARGKRSAPSNASVIEDDSEILEIDEEDDLLWDEPEPTEADLQGIYDEVYDEEDDLADLDDLDLEEF